MNKAVGHRVQLHYTEHPGIPTNCFGDTRYFVDRVTIADNERAAADSRRSGPGHCTGPFSDARTGGPARVSGGLELGF